MSHTFAIVVSRFNESVTNALLEGACLGFLEQGITRDALTIVSVPGAVEIPLTAKLLAKTQRFAAIVCLGAVIRGDTSHYDYVCQQVSMGCQQVMLETEIPLIFGVLTTETEQQALDRAGGSEGNKGKDAATVALEMANIKNKIRHLSVAVSASA